MVAPVMRCVIADREKGILLRVMVLVHIGGRFAARRLWGRALGFDWGVWQKRDAFTGGWREGVPCSPKALWSEVLRCLVDVVVLFDLVSGPL